jgi:hypothetical protein
VGRVGREHAHLGALESPAVAGLDLFEPRLKIPRRHQAAAPLGGGAVAGRAGQPRSVALPAASFDRLLH